MKTIVFFILFIQLVINSFSQVTDFGMQVGAGNFNMTEFKEINEIVKNSLPFESKITANFPMNIIYKIYLHHTYKNNFGVGLKYSFSSTGSMISREDYSGSYYFKNQVRFQSLGLVFDYCIISTSRVNVIMYNELGWEFSKSKMHESLTLSGQTQDDIKEFRSVNIFTEPGLKIVYPFKSIVNFGFYAGYLIDTHSQIKESNSIFKLKELYDLSYGKNSLNWSGFRLGILVAVKIPD